ncbi:NADH dehydrogenase [ubiquinone] 1 alpha subcomplex assembly factor 3 isoform X1 [Ranitomeya variabilis]|uniref:NADH dehydrogenase [ubiquinone] 1 alpha subcomplex assembly factor 3 isoform X1 n=2 Tax=Ranitomeya variabilis TaxID=490064 RepID=UPI0040572B8D
MPELLCPVDPMAPLISLGLPLLRLSAPRLVKYRPSIAAHAWQQSRSHRLSPAGDELYEKTTVTRIERDSAEMMLIESYSSVGFIINGDQVVGPCAVLPRSILQWNVASYKDVSLESLSLFHLLVPKIEILVLGTGDRVQRLDPAISRFMRQKGVALEVQDTANACATFNFLTSERRVTAAALIPVSA